MRVTRSSEPAELGSAPARAGPPHALLAAQRGAGNAAVGRLLRAATDRGEERAVRADAALRLLARQPLAARAPRGRRGTSSAREVVVTGPGRSARWSRQFCRQAPWAAREADAAGMHVPAGTRQLQLMSTQTRAGIVAAIGRAARAAGPGGRVLYSVGHGNGVRNGANLTLADDGSFTVDERILAGGTFLSQVGVTATMPLSADEADIRSRFVAIGRALEAARVSELVFLVCGVGANQSFMRRIKSAWGGQVRVGGYADGVVLQEDLLTDDPTYPRTRLYLWRDGVGNPGAYGTGSSAVPRSWLETPAGLVVV